MIEILREPLANYLTEKRKSFTENWLASKFRNEYPQIVQSFISDHDRYQVEGSAGQSQWADCPWIAILDLVITKSPQSGYYPVLLFKSDMTGVYLSLNQGVTEIKQDYKKNAKKVLKIRAEDFRAKLNLKVTDYLFEINLEARTTIGKYYEAGNILAKYYPASALPSTETLRKDLQNFMELYEELNYNDNSQTLPETIGVERKQLRIHWRIERSSSLAKKVKKIKGCKCEVCGMVFVDRYGALGYGFIEVHHLIPISTLEVGNFSMNLEDDFAVLCSNCHSMIHRLEDPSDLNKLRQIIKSMEEVR